MSEVVPAMIELRRQLAAANERSEKLQAQLDRLHKCATPNDFTIEHNRQLRIENVALRQQLAEAQEELRELTKRLAMTSRGAKINDAIERAASILPEGYLVSIEIERGAGTVALRTPDDARLVMDDDSDCRLASEIDCAIALAAVKGEK